MASERYKQMQRNTAVQAAKLKSEGFTYKEIAELLSIKPEQVKAKVLLGERLING